MPSSTILSIIIVAKNTSLISTWSILSKSISAKLIERWVKPLVLFHGSIFIFMHVLLRGFLQVRTEQPYVQQLKQHVPTQLCVNSVSSHCCSWKAVVSVFFLNCSLNGCLLYLRWPTYNMPWPLLVPCLFYLCRSTVQMDAKRLSTRFWYVSFFTPSISVCNPHSFPYTADLNILLRARPPLFDLMVVLTDSKLWFYQQPEKKPISPCLPLFLVLICGEILLLLKFPPSLSNNWSILWTTCQFVANSQCRPWNVRQRESMRWMPMSFWTTVL